MRSTKAIRLCAAAVAATAAVAALLVAPTSGAAAAPAATAPTGPRLMGAHFDDSSSTGVAVAAWKQALVKSELDAGRRLDLVSTSPYGFTATFPSWREPWIADNGSEPVITWSPGLSTTIANGRQDGVLAARATALAAFAKPVMLEYAPGMDSAATSAAVVSPDAFKAAWIRAHDVFAAHHASNVAWVWCPSADSWANGTATQWYPGSQYVDWVCAESPTQSLKISFAARFGPFRDSAPALGKPMMIGSFGVVDGYADHKAQWLTTAYHSLATGFSTISAAIADGTGSAAMATSSTAESAWATAVSQPALYTAPATTLPGGPLVPRTGTTLLGTMLMKGSLKSEPVAWNNLEAASGNNVDVAQTIYRWGAKVPSWRDKYNASQGRIPMISWGIADTHQIVAGTYDSYIVTTATRIKALGTEVFLRWAWEMDSGYFAPQAISPESFKAAWAHIHAIFASVGATNVAWVWSPTAYGYDTGKAPAYYPGDNLVDWVSADGFNAYPGVPGAKPLSFATIFTSFTAWARQLGKPMMVAATGALESDVDPMAKADWLRDMSRAVQVLDPEIRSICYLDTPAGWYSDPSLTLHWELNSSANAMQAWAAIAHGPTFADAR